MPSDPTGCGHSFVAPTVGVVQRDNTYGMYSFQQFWLLTPFARVLASDVTKPWAQAA